MRIYALLILLCCSTLSFSQNCNFTLKGKVIDLHDGSSLVGATLIIAGTEKAVLSDINGDYIFENLCEQTYNIQVSHPACQTEAFSVKISGNTTKNLNLEHHLEELNQVTLEGNTFTTKSKTIVSNTISREELEKFSSGSLGDALNSLSGVSSLNTGNTVIKPLINGLHSSRVTIINNGVRLEDQDWGAEHAPNIDINTAGNITLIKGAGALQYSGDAVGGIIISEARKAPIKDSIYGKTIVSGMTNGRGTSITSQLTKSTQKGYYATLQGTLKRFGDFESPDYVLSNTGIYERNASLRLGYNRINFGIEGYYSLFKNTIGILRASHLGGGADQVRAINSDRPLVINNFTYNINEPRQDVTHHLATFKGFKDFDFGTLSVQYDFQLNNRLEFDIRRGDDRDKASLDLTLTTHTIHADLDSDLSEKTTLKIGTVAQYQENTADPDTGVRRLIPDYESYDLGIYGIADYRYNENLLVEAGVRFDYTYMDVFKFYRTSFWEARGYDVLFPELVIEEFDNQLLTNPQLNFYNPSATAGLTYNFNEGYKLFVNYSLASRAPNPSELFSEGLHHSASRIELGDLRFNSELSQKVSLTFQKSGERFDFSVNPYVNTIKDFIVIEPTSIQQTVRGNFQVWEYRQTNAQLLGVDVDASYLFDKNFSFEHQFSFVKGYDRSRDIPLINIPAVNAKNKITYQNNKFKNLQLGLESAYYFRQNEFPNNNFEVFIPETETTEVVDVSTPPDAYHLLNLTSSIDFALNEKSDLRVGLDITNLLDTSYRNYLNRLRYYADDLGRNFLLNLKINY